MANNLDAFTPEVWSKRILTKLDQINVMLPLCNREYEGEIREKGDTVWVRTFGNVSTAPYTRGAPINYGDLAPTKESLVIDDAQYFAFKVDDLDVAQNDISALDGYTQRAAVAMSNLVEAKLMAQYTLAHASNKVTSSGSPITLSTSNAYTSFVDAGKLLDDQNVGPDGRWAVIGPAYKAILLKDTTYFLRATDMADSVLRSGRMGSTARTAPGFLGQVAGFDVYLSNALPTSASGRYNLFGGKDGSIAPISYAGQIKKLQKITLETSFADAVRGLLLHDATVFTEHRKCLGYIYTDV